MKKINRKINKTIDSYSKSYKEYIDNTIDINTFPDVARDIDIFINYLNGKKVIDVAFGSGRDIVYFLSKSLEVSGIELTNEFIVELQKRVDIPLFLMDMRDIKLPDSNYDGVWCCSSFSHIPKEDSGDTLIGFNRLLKKGGILFLSIKSGKGEEWVSKGNINEMPRYFSYYNKNEISDLLSSSGFEVISIIDDSSSSRWLSVFSRKIN
jgi:ubiquinone/menaquinone biosynthesis C-methylase UbiE